MPRLFLLRHAKAEPGGPGVPDHSRPLAYRGELAAERLGAYMARHGLVPDHVVCSTATRTRQTWMHLSASLAADTAEPVFERRLYDATAERILDLIRAAPKQASALMLVGHNPGFHQIALALIAAGDVETRERLAEKLPTGGLVVVDFSTTEWSAVHPAAGRLDRFVTPRSLDDETA